MNYHFNIYSFHEFHIEYGLTLSAKNTASEIWVPKTWQNVFMYVCMFVYWFRRTTSINRNDLLIIIKPNKFGQKVTILDFSFEYSSIPSSFIHARHNSGHQSPVKKILAGERYHLSASHM